MKYALAISGVFVFLDYLLIRWITIPNLVERIKNLEDCLKDW